MAYDSHRRVSVFLTREEYLPDSPLFTYEWDGATWRLRQVGGPPPLSPPSPLCYDSARRRCVMLNANGETWEWDGEEWALNPAAGPPPRQGFALAFDSIRDVIVLFGGRSGTPYLNDTWEFDGVEWTQRPLPGPPPRAYHAMAFDCDRGVTVLWGGLGSVGGLDQTWEYDGAQWVMRDDDFTTGWAHSMFYDPVRKRTVVWGGEPSPFYMLWDGVEWSWGGPIQNIGPLPFYPTSYISAAMVYDTHRSRVVAHGGFGWVGNLDMHLSLTWEMTSDNVRTVLIAPPPSQDEVYFAYDPLQSRCVLVDRLTSGGRVWLLDSATRQWSAHVSPGPPARRASATAFDIARGRLVLLGGQVSNQPANDLWEWSDRGWMQRIEPGPSPRFSHAMTYDAARGETVVFGGLTSSGPPPWVLSRETWTWDGADWTLATTGGPTARASAAMAFDPTRNVVVLFGGTMGATEQYFLNDTWEWNGRAWTLVGTGGPAPRCHHSMTFDAARGKVVMYGGVGPLIPNYGNVRQDAWEWDGAQWTQMQDAPSSNLDAGLVFDLARSRLMLLSRFSELFEFGDDLRFTEHPNPVRTLAGQTVIFETHAQSASPITFQWRKDGVELRGETGSTLIIDGVNGSHIGDYDVVATTECGSLVSPPASLTIGFPCAADVFPPGGNGMINVLDLLAVINAWGACPTPPATCPDSNVDGVVNLTDLLAVVENWGACIQ